MTKLVLRLFLGSILLFSLNHTAGFLLNKGDYTPFSVGATVGESTFDESHAYLLPATRVFRSLSIKGDPDTYELKDTRTILPKLSPILVGLLARILGSIEKAWILSHALFPALTTCLLFLFFLKALGQTIPSLFCTLVTVLLAFSPQNGLLLGWQAFYQPLEVTRMLHPATSFPVLLVGLLLLYKVLEGTASKTQVAILSIVSGFMAQSYFFYWVPFYLSLGLLFSFLLLSKRYEKAKVLFVILVVTVLISSFEIRQNSQAMEANRYLLARLGTYLIYASPMGMKFFALGLLTSVLCFLRKEKTEFYNSLGLILLLISATGIGMNLQLITHYDGLNELHFTKRLLQPLLAIAGLLVLMRFAIFALRKEFTHAFCVLCSVLLVGAASFRQVKVAINTKEDHLRSSSKMEVLLWIREHLPKESVVASRDVDLVALLPSVTGSWTFIPSMYRTAALDEEILTRYLIASKLSGKNHQEMFDDLMAKEVPLPRLWRSLSHMLIGRHELPKEMQNWMTDTYLKLSPLGSTEGRRLDYLIVENNNPLVQKGFSVPLFKNKDWAILEVQKRLPAPPTHSPFSNTKVN